MVDDLKRCIWRFRRRREAHHEPCVRACPCRSTHRRAGSEQSAGRTTIPREVCIFRL